MFSLLSLGNFVFNFCNFCVDFGVGITIGSGTTLGSRDSVESVVLAETAVSEGVPLHFTDFSVSVFNDLLENFDVFEGV